MRSIYSEGIRERSFFASFELALHEAVLDHPVVTVLFHLHHPRPAAVQVRLPCQILLHFATHQHIDVASHDARSFFVEVL